MSGAVAGACWGDWPRNWCAGSPRCNWRSGVIWPMARWVEIDAQYAISTAARTGFNLAWTDAVFIRYQGAPCWPGQSPAQGCASAINNSRTQDLSGLRMPDSPHWKANASAEYTWFSNHARPFDLTLAGTYAWRSDVPRMLANQNPQSRQPAFGIFNPSLGMSWHSDRSSRSRFSTALFVNNVFDKFYLLNADDFFSALWGPGTNVVFATPARDSSRYIGLRLNWEFD